MPTIDDGKRAIGEGNPQQARLIFEAILQETPRSEQAWMGLAEVLTDTNDKRICYENVLKINKDNRQARQAIRNLEPEANPLIAALQQSTASRAEEEDDEGYTETFIRDDTTIVSESSPATSSARAPTMQATGGPPTVALVAVGLLLSVVVFAIGGGAMFFVLGAIR